jgi:hypothetical protein
MRSIIKKLIPPILVVVLALGLATPTLASCPQPSQDYGLALNTGPDLEGEPGKNGDKPDKELPPAFGKLIRKLLSSILTSSSSGKKEYNFNVETSPNLKVKGAEPKQSEGVEVNGEGELRLAMPLKFLLGDSFIDLKLGGKYGANAGIEADLEEKPAPPAVPPQPPAPPPVEPVNICLEPVESTDPEEEVSPTHPEYLQSVGKGR